MASPAIAIFGSFVSVSFWVQEKAEMRRRRERMVFKRVGDWRMGDWRIREWETGEWEPR
jgi:hypothetical protein